MNWTAPEWDAAALLVIDMQNDFASGGAMPVEGTDDVIAPTIKLIEQFRRAERPIFHVIRLYDGTDIDLARRDLVLAGNDIVRPGTDGAHIIDGLLEKGFAADPELLLNLKTQALGPKEWIMWKPRWGAFHRTRLTERLRSHLCSTVVIAGCNFPNCPRATAVAASERDLRVVIATDAVSSFNHQHARECLAMGMQTASVDDVAADLGNLPRSGHQVAS